jgi:pimeloyl-ACP methyl ester carboxylesterase
MPAVTAQPRTSYPVRYETVHVRDLDIFYRSAGPESAPTILLLHGFPTSSNMFRNLIPRLAGSFRVIAPDFPGYGQSSMPDRESFAYTFENIAAVMNDFVEAIGLQKYSMYVMDYGAPVGYRSALMQPEPRSRTRGAERQCLRGRAARVLGSDQKVLGGPEPGEPR